ncbi:MAG TPA: glycoside hydrolase family 3 N-terminal domain-containing protein, partial [Solirubrobacteraceae bacterium]|nr:glycoside hydrolase family 3 N-terminal domain-containing protein [Solirubrobacteraceae bacterium]
MSERIAAAVWVKPKRRVAFCSGVVAVFVVAVVAFVSVMSSASGAAPAKRRPHQAGAGNSGLSQGQINARVTALINQMSPQEKFGQLTMAGPATPTGSDLIPLAEKGEIGSVLDLTGVDNINAVQKAAVDDSPLHIPLIFGLDVIHGYRTMFPVPLGESATWDPAQVAKDESVSADEAAADGIKWTFNPMVDISRDPRWGRVVEGAGEDPFLGSAIAAAKVQGYQGNNYAAPNKVAATIKHFGGYGAPVAGREYNTVDMSTQQLFNDYLPPYKAAVDAGAATVMSSFNSLNGVPNTANPYMLTQILRQEWGFSGTTLSDYQAVQELEAFGYASDGEDAARLALTAGENIEMAVSMTSTNPVYDTYATWGPQLLAKGKITMAQLNDAVRHVLTLKYLAGMFSDPDQGSPTRYANEELTPAHQAVALQTAEESLVLLNNNNHALPLSPSTSSIAVVGPLGDDALDQLGPDVPIGYDTTDLKTTDKIVTVSDGIKQADPGATVTTVPGCTTFTVADPCNETTGFGAAVAAAQAADVTVVVVGEPAGDSGEASSRTNLDLPGQQEQLISQIAATGKPYVIVLMNGRPLTIPELGGDPTTHAGGAPAMLEAWYPGTTGGTAIANALFGKYDPSGHLTMSFPQNVGQIPMSYDELPTGRPYDPNNKYTSRYLDVSNSPEYPFGYGLSYTSFSISSPQIQGHPSRNGTFRVSATVKNTGSTAGVDVAQLYLHESDTPILQPV